MTLKSVLAIIYLSLFGSILAFSCYLWLLRVTAASRVATYAYANPLVAIILGALFVNEPVSMRVIIAGIAIILAVVMINLSKARAMGAAKQVRVSGCDRDWRGGTECEPRIVRRPARIVESLPSIAAQAYDARSVAGPDGSGEALKPCRGAQSNARDE